ncbi:UAA transporter [Tilletiopsis washingtonensis]|uniref:UDP-galactose transporter homolog 1 n=1 Tax=Tilletiopsis washingtonensis TaxID=58919 RepID=A0A316Z4D9_9BASI|nr:UAA transporter [Tilletiopsis washingtonensis]PWN95792.1 UAA transporter [Tilletiopsis washingtonensis]
MSLAQLTLSVATIYTFFLLWGLLQERLTTTAYTLPPHASLAHSASAHLRGQASETFRHPLLLNALQAIACTALAASYLLLRRAPGVKPLAALGLDALSPRGAVAARREKDASAVPGRISPLLLRYLAVAAFQSTASQLGLLSLSHGISYPTLTLAKSCKLLPVLFAQVLLYRRRIAPHKYLVVALVTAGISLFMLCAPAKPGKAARADSSLGLALLLANLFLDGLTNSTQDEIFAHYRVSGPQMMFLMNLAASFLLSASLLFPRGGAGHGNELTAAAAFISRHPTIIKDLAAYSAAGAMGQIAIFETLQRFGSLTLVSITVTRKLFTMLLSILVYGHALRPAQWLGVLVVFVGLGVEAAEKRRAGARKTASASAGAGGAKEKTS